MTLLSGLMFAALLYQMAPTEAGGKFDYRALSLNCSFGVAPMNRVRIVLWPKCLVATGNRQQHQSGQYSAVIVTGKEDVHLGL